MVGSFQKLNLCIALLAIVSLGCSKPESSHDGSAKAIQATNTTTAEAWSPQGSQGGNSGGGGDIECDARIKEIIDNLTSWIENKGPESGKKIDLMSTLNPDNQKSYTVEQYETLILEMLHKPLDSSCVSEGHKDYPVEVQSSKKICKSYLESGRIRMTCDKKWLMSLSETEQIQQIHHEIAIHVRGLEPDNGPISTYKISSQLSSYLKNKTQTKLAVLREDDEFRCSFKKMTAHSVQCREKNDSKDGEVIFNFQINENKILVTENKIKEAYDLSIGQKAPYEITGGSGFESPETLSFPIYIYLNRDGLGQLVMETAESGGNCENVHMIFQGYNTNDGAESTDSFRSDLLCSIIKNK